MRANAIRQFLQYGPATGSQLGQPVFVIAFGVSLQSELSKDQIENSPLLANGCGTDPIADQRILRWRFGVCELVHIHSNVFLPLCRLLAAQSGHRSQTRPMSAIGGEADGSSPQPTKTVGGQFGVAGGVLYVAVAKVSLQHDCSHYCKAILPASAPTPQPPN
jgi:hypothetical protein